MNKEFVMSLSQSYRQDLLDAIQLLSLIHI